jgi:hypothetical protein
MPVVQRTTKVAAEIAKAPYAHTSSAVALLERIEQFAAYPAARELPELPA